MSTPELNPVSYVLLGLVARDGPTTAYEVKTAVGRGIAHFWPFPHSQIYSESQRLAGLGLLAEEQENTGRRRRTFRITKEGDAALKAWLAEPTHEIPQFRYLALLKLFFGQFANEDDILQLARAQLEMFEEGLGLYRQLMERLRERGDRPWQLEVGKMGMAAHEAFRDHWQRLERTLSKAELEAQAGTPR